jgi:hypothetical protein
VIMRGGIVRLALHGGTTCRKSRLQPSPAALNFKKR